MADSTGKPAKKARNRTIGSILRYFVGMELQVELKTGRTYAGRLQSADDGMNLLLEEARVVMTSLPATQRVAGADQLLSIVSLRGSTIRYIHFPPSINLTAAIKAGADRERAASHKYKKYTRK